MGIAVIGVRKRAFEAVKLKGGEFVARSGLNPVPCDGPHAVKGLFQYPTPVALSAP
jgi:hypothetical protein